ncbi:nineteen complex-related protein 2-domain-containing protein [Pilobolus umbonatus]|nr:nineteen complex-related protein 2-domain-containing protein [Pilobolus umbonatus]
MFKKTTRTKNIRRKVEYEDHEAEAEEVIKKTITTSEKKKKKDPLKFRPLSFEATEEEEEFQVKKTSKRNTGHPILEVKKTIISEPEELDTSNLSLYDAQSLKQLRDNTPTLPISLKSTSSDDSLLHEKFPLTMNATISNIGIPDSNAILAAKKLREQKRKGFTVHDGDTGFISLNDANKDEEDEGPRLTREEDDLDDGEEELEKYVGGNIALNKTKKTQEKERREELRDIIELVEDDDDISEDMERWKADMIKFGGVRSRSKKENPFDPPPNYKPANIPDIPALPAVSDILKSLDASINTLTESIQQYESNLDESIKAVEHSISTEEDIMNEMERGSERYNYFQDLSQFLNDLGEFLDAKFPELERLESEAHDIINTRSDIALSRKWQDGLDDLFLFRDMSKTSLDEEMSNADTEEIDEFGRVRELRHSETARQRRRKERMNRLSRYMHDSEDRLKEEGLWTDDDMQEDYNEQRQFKLKDIQTNQIDVMMTDVKEEFKSLELVMHKFEDWKTKYNDDYQKAYGSLSIPTAFEFYIRMELISWDPFTDPVEFESMQWHKTLSQFGHSTDEQADIEMLNRIVEKYIIRKVRSLLDTLNVSSSKQMKNAVQVADQISYYMERDHKAYTEFAMDVVNTLEKQITHFVDLIETSMPLRDLSNEAQEAKQRFFWSQYKYLKVLMYCRRILPSTHIDRLQRTIIDRLIAPILNPDRYPSDAHLQNEALGMVSRLNK